jgi:hypothetical protein
MKNANYKIHINAVFNAIDQLFSEAVEVTDKNLIAKIMESEAGIKPPIYQYQPIDSKNADALRALADKRLSNYLKQHTDNSMPLFIDYETETARLFQQNLPRYRTDDKQKTYYFRLERWIEVLEKMLPQQAEAKPQKFEAPTISLFCTLMNDSGTIRRYESESIENYCKRICEEFKLKYTDRVRQNFDSTADTKDNRIKLKSRLLPIIETETKDKLLQYLDTKHPTEQNLYG